ncbi:MAG: hypothetical protein ACRENJ_03575 [Candidatus Eiseniibacteriota bacterium]
MKMRHVVPSLLIVLGLSSAAPAHGLTTPGKARLRAWMGFTTLALGDINGEIRARRDAFMADTLVDESSWDPLGGAPGVGAELEVQMTPVLSAGFGFSAHRGSIGHQALRILSIDVDTGEPGEIESFDENLTVTAWDLVGNVGLWVPSAPGLHFGAQLGLVRGTFQRESMYLIDAFTVEPNMQLREGTWKGTGVVLGAFTGYEQPLSSQLAFTSRLGYRHRKVGRLDGTEIITDWGDQGNAREWEVGPLVDANGNRVALDIGGFYFKVGLTMALGGGD